MQLLPNDERYLHRALDLAREAAAFASPNPSVGCLLVRGNTVIGEGAHIYDHQDHAEIAALKQAAAQGASVEGATAYVTLEPCAHHGRTGPCSVALVSAKIKRCVVATVDPNPQVGGRGLQILRDGGVAVELADPASEIAISARELIDAFAFSIRHGRPFVILKAAVSLDGYLAPPPELRRDREPHWLTGQAARDDVQALRYATDAILTGVGTVLSDNPMLTDRTKLPRRRPLLRVVLDSRLRTPPNSALIQSAARDLIVITTRSAPESAAAALEALGVEVVRAAESAGRVDLHSAMQVLQERNIRSVLLEGGSSINAGFLSAELVDKVVLYFSDTELGHGSVPFAGFLRTPYELQRSLTRMARRSFTHDSQSGREDVRVSGYVHDPWEGVA